MSKIRWFTDKNEVEPSAVEQVEQTASMPFVHGLAVMPDVHYGKGSTVGTVIATEGAVIPAAVGVDIGCGMIAARTNLRVSDLEGKREQIMTGIERRIPLGVGQNGYNRNISLTAAAAVECLEEWERQRFPLDGTMDEYTTSWREQLGSLGGGNHFIEICAGVPTMSEEIASAHDGDDIADVWVILHSGSRGIGNKVGTYWTRKAQELARKYKYDGWLPHIDLAYFTQSMPEFDNYLKQAAWCQAFARYNREEMLQRVLTELMYTTGIDLSMFEKINCHHNYVEWEQVGDKSMLITRKGAIMARKGVRGLIPGSMGAPSYIVTGLGHEGSFHSAPHGAGRKMSRTTARKNFDVAGLSAEMESKNITARIRGSIVDEAPGAYKDIEMVMYDARELVTPTDRLTQLISVKGD